MGRSFGEGLLVAADRSYDITIPRDLAPVDGRFGSGPSKIRPEAVAALAEAAEGMGSLLAERVSDEMRASIRSAIGVAGTITSLAAIDLDLEEYDPERVHGHVVAAEAVAEQLDRLAALPLAERRRVRGLEPARAPVIVGGVLVVREVLGFFALEELEASEHDLLHGVALEAATLPEPVEGDAPPGAYTCC